MNVLLITTDQMRRDHMGCEGNPVIRTPALDRLAREGVSLRRAYVNNPVCMPNRASLATGRLPANHGCWANGIDLPDDERTVADVLGQHGYRTALLGKPHFRITAMPFDHVPRGIECGPAWELGLNDPAWSGPYYGFDYVQLTVGHGYANLNRAHLRKWVKRHYPQALANQFKWEMSAHGEPECFTPLYPHQAHSSNWLGQIGCEYLRERAADAQPFLLWVSFPDPHHPFCPPKPYDTMYDPASAPMPRLGEAALAGKPPHYRSRGLSDAQIRDIIVRTYGMISLVDENIARLLGELDRTGLADNTIVIFTSDHGDLMGDCGMTHKGPWLLEGLANVPMIWRVPEKARSSGLSGPHPARPGQAASGIKVQGLFSTCDIAPTVLALLGIERPRAMDGLAQAELVCGGPGRRQEAYIEYRTPAGDNLRAVVTDRRKLIHYAGQPYGELYDMTAELPDERNLWSDPAHASEKADLTRRLLDSLILHDDRRLWPTAGA